MVEELKGRASNEAGRSKRGASMVCTKRATNGIELGFQLAREWMEMSRREGAVGAEDEDEKEGMREEKRDD